MKSKRLQRLQRWNSTLKSRAFETYAQFLEVLCKSTNCEASRLFLPLLHRRDWDGLFAVADCIASSVFSTPAEHRLNNQFSALVRKYPFPKGSVKLNPREAALKTFLLAEQECQRINQRFKLFDTLESPHEQALSQARSWIAYVLGDFSIADVQSECEFGPGASIGIHGNATNRGRKFLARSWSVSAGAFYYSYRALYEDYTFRELVNQDPGRLHYAHDPVEFRRRLHKKVAVVDHNNIAFVAKTAKTERTIAVEPLLNGYLQKGVDQFMRKRLKRVGIDLADQSRNQAMARLGSLPDEPNPYVTIDLSAASDSISIGLVRNLLPPDWFDYLNSIRSPAYKLDGKIMRYHKFVTMGNGFCFPLETLIFASLCHVAYSEHHRKPDFSVYGDDIIVRQDVAPRVLELLQVCGFKPNPDKTFLSGPFRESCGADWYEGENVRPLNLDYAFDSVESIFKFANMSRRVPSWRGILDQAVDYLVGLVPPDLRFVRPYKGQPDTALEVDMDAFLASPFSRWHLHLCCWSWVELTKTGRSDLSLRHCEGYNIALLRGALTGSTSSAPFTVRRETTTKIRRVSYAGGWSLWEPGVTFSKEIGFSELLL